MKKILYISFIILPLFVFSQKQGNIWYFGDHAGLNFNTSIPIILNNGATHNGIGNCPVEGSAVICDSSGSLLFYTNGQQIWNKNHQIMPNGNNLLGNLSSTQSALIVPKPGSSRFYYVFTTDDFCNNALQFGFRYSIVDICHDNGLGDVTDDKNIKLLDTVAEKLIAIRDNNGLDYWIVIHKYFSNAFYSYHLSSNGIDDTVISYVGSYHPLNMIGTGGAIGQMKASPNGNRIALVNGNGNSIAEYFDFNNSTGIVSNCVNIQTNPAYNYYGVSFSPDNSKLYITCWLNDIGLYQFDLNAGGGNPASVIASRTEIIGQGLWLMGMQLATDGKIYIVQNHYLSVINNPNYIGANCNFQDFAIYLNGNFSGYSLPNFIDSYAYTNTTFDCTTVSVESFQEAEFKIYPNPASTSINLDGVNKLYNFRNL